MCPFLESKAHVRCVKGRCGASCAEWSSMRPERIRTIQEECLNITGAKSPNCILADTMETDFHQAITIERFKHLMSILILSDSTNHLFARMGPS